MEDEAWRYTFDEDGNMVERRCMATLLAQTEGAAGSPPARNEVNPRAGLALAVWSFPDKDQIQSVETVFEPVSFQNVSISYSLSGYTKRHAHVLYVWMSREADEEFVYYVRSR